MADTTLTTAGALSTGTPRPITPPRTLGYRIGQNPTGEGTAGIPRCSA